MSGYFDTSFKELNQRDMLIESQGVHSVLELCDRQIIPLLVYWNEIEIWAFIPL